MCVCSRRAKWEGWHFKCDGETCLQAGSRTASLTMCTHAVVGARDQERGALGALAPSWASSRTVGAGITIHNALLWQQPAVLLRSTNPSHISCVLPAGTAHAGADSRERHARGLQALKCTAEHTHSELSSSSLYLVATASGGSMHLQTHWVAPTINQLGSVVAQTCGPFVLHQRACAGGLHPLVHTSRTATH